MVLSWRGRIVVKLRGVCAFEESDVAEEEGSGSAESAGM